MAAIKPFWKIKDSLLSVIIIYLVCKKCQKYTQLKHECTLTTTASATTTAATTLFKKWLPFYFLVTLQK